jgi:phosphopantetheine adenylyltransferase/dephospho-CoA kinase
MFKCGLVVLTVPLHKVLPCVGGFLKQASDLISNVIYIKLEPMCATLPITSGSSSGRECSGSKRVAQQNELINVIPNIYRIASARAPQRDVRVIVERVLQQLHHVPEVLLTNECGDHKRIQQLQSELTRSCHVVTFGSVSNLPSAQSAASAMSSKATVSDEHLIVQSDETLQYDHTCLGGTFDELHNGHKVLLNEALVRTKNCLVVGVTDDSMLRTKLLSELIAPVKQRIETLSRYLCDVNDRITYDIRPIHDPFGPSIELPHLQCLIVSDETLNGGKSVNRRREERGMAPLDLFVTKLLSEQCRQVSVEEDKVSSSSLRIRKLGTVIREPTPRPDLPNRPYLIGLTGGICSGKSTILETLQKLGAGVINCDHLAHQTYAQTGSAVYEAIRREFGDSVIDSCGAIDRRRLGQIVFQDSSMLSRLNRIVWPATERLIHERLQQLNAKHDVIVLEAALLLEADWDLKFHQIWVSIISEEEAVQRLYERNALDRDQAIQRIRAQITNAERVARANVIFSSQWPVSVTQQQVHKAWQILKEKYLNAVPT